MILNETVPSSEGSGRGELCALLQDARRRHPHSAMNVNVEIAIISGYAKTTMNGIPRNTCSNLHSNIVNSIVTYMIIYESVLKFGCIYP